MAYYIHGECVHHHHHHHHRNQQEHRHSSPYAMHLDEKEKIKSVTEFQQEGGRFSKLTFQK